MITKGQIALFCSRELDTTPTDDIIDAKGEINTEAGMEKNSGRKRFGGGFLWQKSGDVIQLQAYWRTGVVPLGFRLHLFGTTEEQTIGCLVVECAVSEHINSVFINSLCRTLITFKCEKVIEFDTNVDVEAFRDKDALTVGVDI